MSTCIRLFSLITVFILSFSSGFALDMQNVEKIRQVIDDYTDAWNHHKGVGFAKDFVDDADFVNILGMHFKGKAEIEDRHVKILDTFLKNTILEIQEVTLRQLTPDIVIAHVTWHLDGTHSPIPTSGTKYLPEIQQGIFTQVFSKENNQWKIVASQNTIIPNSPY